VKIDLMRRAVEDILKGDSKDLPNQDSLDAGLVLLASHTCSTEDKFLMRDRDDRHLAAITGLSIDRVFGITAALVSGGVWRDPLPDLDDGLTFIMAVQVAIGLFERLPNGNWRLTEKGKMRAEELVAEAVQAQTAASPTATPGKSPKP